MYDHILKPYTFGLRTLHDVVMDSSRHVVLQCNSEISPRHLWTHFQNLSYEKYDKVLRYAHLIKTENPVVIDAGYYIPTYCNFYHTLIDGIPRAWGAFEDKTHDLIMCQNNLDAFKGLRAVVENWLPRNSLSTYTVDPKFAVLPDGSTTYGTTNRLHAKKLSYFSVLDVGKDDARVVNRRLAVALWQKYANEHWETKPPRRRLFVGRLKDYNLTQRCANQVDLAAFLKRRHGFELWCTEDHNLIENAKAFREAKVIVGVHGAALSHLAFCSPETKFVHLTHKNKSEHFFNCICDFANVRRKSVYGINPKIGKIATDPTVLFEVSKANVVKAITELLK